MISLVLILVASIAIAALPIMIYAAVLQRLSLDRHVATWLLTLGLGWGAAGAVFLGLVWTLVLGRPFEVLLQRADFSAVESVFLAPLAEELAKAVFFLFLIRLRRIETALMGLVFGIGSGLGFAMTENLAYFLDAWVEDGQESWIATVMIRTLFSGVVHASATGLWGAFLGYARSETHPLFRYAFPYAGMIGAIALHGGWNFSQILTRVSGSDIPMTVAAYTVVTTVLLMSILTYMALEQEKRLLLRELAGEVDRNSLPPGYLRFLCSPLARLRRGWLPEHIEQGTFVATAVDLALTKRRLRRSGIDPDARDLEEVESQRDTLTRILGLPKEDQEEPPVERPSENPA